MLNRFQVSGVRCQAERRRERLRRLGEKQLNVLLLIESGNGKYPRKKLCRNAMF
jgi:hypothetical protein